MKIIPMKKFYCPSSLRLSRIPQAFFTSKRRNQAVAACAALSLAMLGGCSGANSSSESKTTGTHEDTLAVSASFYPIAWLAEQIGGDAIEVTSVTPANVEPHEFELSPKDVSALSKADLIAYVEGFQPSMDDAVATVSEPQKVNLASAVDLQKADAATAEHEEEHHHDDADHEHEHDDADHEHAHEHDTLGLDPHFWLDPERMAEAGEALEEALAQADPANKETFENNYDALEDKLDKLDESFTTGLKQCSLTTIVTSHAAFGYLTSQYGLTQKSISGVDPESEPSPADLSAVKKVVQDSGTTTIFTEELVSPKTAEAVAEETGASTAVLSPLESKPESGDYISAMEENLQALRTALQCK